jgi:hypothetical protein
MFNGAPPLYPDQRISYLHHSLSARCYYCPVVSAVVQILGSSFLVTAEELQQLVQQQQQQQACQ